MDNICDVGKLALPPSLTAAAHDHHYWHDNEQLTSIRTAACTVAGARCGLGYDAQGKLENKDEQHYRFDYDNRLRRSMLHALKERRHRAN